MRVTAITPAFLDNIPEHLEEGILYICERYRTAAHKCCCGCGEEVITPLTPADWSVKQEGSLVSLVPSIGNWSFDCKSHYWIYRNRVVWARRFSQTEITKVKARDFADKKAYIAAVNRQKEGNRWSSVIAKLWQALMHWRKS